MGLSVCACESLCACMGVHTYYVNQKLCETEHTAVFGRPKHTLHDLKITCGSCGLMGAVSLILLTSNVSVT